MNDLYRVGSSLGTTIFRDGEAQPCAWCPNDPELANRIVVLLNSAQGFETEFIPDAFTGNL